MNSVFAGIRVAVVIPVFNERDALSDVLDRLRLLPVETIVVDDGSSDGSADIARAKADAVAVHAVNLGQGAALQTGIELARQHDAHIIITFDSDGQHSTSDIPLLVQAIRDNRADFALGSRFLGEARGMPWLRKVVLKLGVIFTRALSGIRVTDTHNGLRAMTRRGAEAIHLTLNRMEHASQFLDQVVASGLRYVEVPVRITYTSQSLAKGQANTAAMRIAAKLMVERLG